MSSGLSRSVLKIKSELVREFLSIVASEVNSLLGAVFVVGDFACDELELDPELEPEEFEDDDELPEEESAKRN